MLTNIIFWVVFGLIAGAIAKWIHPGPDPGGWLVTMIIGIVGAVVGGWIFSLFGSAGVSGFNLGSFIVAIIGAVICLAIYRRVA